MTNRLVYIDVLKGFAIFLVVVGHVLQYCVKDSDVSYLYKAITTFHMPLFAFLSGLMFSAKYDLKEMARKLVKQSQKLLVPFFSFGMIYAYTIRSGEHFMQHPFKLGLWYLFFLWQCYMITHLYNVLTYKFGLFRNNKFSMIVDVLWLVMSFAIFKLLYVHNVSGEEDFWGIIHLCKLYPFFFVGCVIKRYKLFEKCFSYKCKIYADISSLLWICLFVFSLYRYSSLSLMMLLGVFAVYPIVMLFYQNGGGKIFMEKNSGNVRTT